MEPEQNMASARTFGGSARQSAPPLGRVRRPLRRLYGGSTPEARRFRLLLLLLDLFGIGFFIVTSFTEPTDLLHAAEVAIGFVFGAELVARLLASRRPFRDILHPLTWADLIVVASLLAPAAVDNFAFLRVLRMLRLLRSYRVLRDLRERSAFVARNEDLLFSILHVAVFLFVMTALVFVLQVGRNPEINNYVDALYFTVTTLTTTGFGDITLVGTTGRLLAVVIMIFGISLFVRLAQTLFSPSKVRHECPECGLLRHDPDAVHCKHCGALLHIRTLGAS